MDASEIAYMVQDQDLQGALLLLQGHFLVEKKVADLLWRQLYETLRGRFTSSTGAFGML